MGGPETLLVGCRCFWVFLEGSRARPRHASAGDGSVRGHCPSQKESLSVKNGSLDTHSRPPVCVERATDTPGQGVDAVALFQIGAPGPIEWGWMGHERCCNLAVPRYTCSVVYVKSQAWPSSIHWVRVSVSSLLAISTPRHWHADLGPVL